MKKFIFFLFFVGFLMNGQEYTVHSIGYAPPNSFLDSSISIEGDDIFSQVIPLEFDFDFYANTYDEIIGADNGVLSFNTSLAETYQTWLIDDTTLPSTEEPSLLNSIMLWHDLLMMGGGVTENTLIGFKTIGVAPNRRFVANYNEVPQYGADQITSTFQIVLYETSNIIEFYIKQKNFNPEWNNGNAILGIQNEDGSQGLAAPGNNSGEWEAINVAWRFVPYDASFVEAFPANIVICNDGNPTANFNLSSVDAIVSGYRTDTVVFYHLTEEDAFAGVNALNSTSYETSPVTIYARVEENNTGLIDVATVTLDIVLCEGDEDNDGVPNSDENLNQDGNLANTDTDNDGIPNYLDNDDDNDGVLTIDEIPNDSEELFLDTDNDGITNYLDNNDDNDALLTIDEDYNQNGDYGDDDQNNNGIPDYLDAEVSTLNTVEIGNALTIISIYPNPVQDEFYLRAPSDIEVESVSIYHTNGKMIKSITHYNNDVISVSQLPVGMYFLKVYTSMGVQTIQFIKK